MPGSILIPAHDEERVLPETLAALLAELDEDVVVVVACNGCRDRTAEVARSFAPRVRVLEIEEASKVAAIEVAEAAAPPFPRVVLDADVLLSGADANRLIEVLGEEGALAAEPVPRVDLSRSSVWVRAFYAVWLGLHGARAGDVGSGSYALSRAGRGRFGAWPRVISDDGFVRAHFGTGEIRVVPEARTVVRAPRRVRDLVRIKTRSRLGSLELSRRFPELWAAKREGGESLAKKMLGLPVRLWVALPVYLLIQMAARHRASRMASNLAGYRWERDETSR